MWNCERFNVLFCPMSWQEDAIILCVAQEAGWGWHWLLVSTGKCPGYWENTKLSQYWGKKHTKLWHYEGRTKCFLVSRPPKLHSCLYWKMMVMGHHRKYYLFSFLHIHDPGARAQCLVATEINSWMMTFECRGQANNPSHLYTLLSSRPSAYVWSDSLRTDSMPFFRGAFSQAV